MKEKKKRLILIIAVTILFGVLFGFIQADFGKDNTITVGSMNYPEQYILGEMLAQLIEENTDLQVERKLGYDIPDVHKALIDEDIDLYPEYTGAAWTAVLGEPQIYQPDVLYEAVKKAYLDEFDIKWLDRYGFNNTYGLGMKKDKAEELGIVSYSDLALKGRDLVFGAERDFYYRDDGYPGLVDTYGFQFKNKKVLDIDKKYEAIDQGEVDIINTYSTDGLVDRYNLVVLDDNMNFFPPYEAATVITMDTLEEHPELQELLNQLNGRINDDQMTGLNYLVQQGGMKPEEAARLFLQSQGLIKGEQ